MDWSTLAVIIPTVLLLIAAPMYYGFINRRNAMRHAFSSIDLQLKERWNLVANLVETTKSFAAHERETLAAVASARNSRNDSPRRFQEEERISAGLGRMMALAESNPELRSSEHFLDLQRRLTEIESQISAARRVYNSAVTKWNKGIGSFPGHLFAKCFKFERADWFEVGSSAEKQSFTFRTR